MPRMPSSAALRSPKGVDSTIFPRDFAFTIDSPNKQGTGGSDGGNGSTSAGRPGKSLDTATEAYFAKQGVYPLTIPQLGPLPTGKGILKDLPNQVNNTLKGKYFFTMSGGGGNTAPTVTGKFTAAGNATCYPPP